ncbi:MAG: twin-arginine translocase TatA/TatE family subunit [Gammaproteobacteria bacterium HGW-Gammaproteobacteria-3]|jgi:sec-independent protein translocase protein TatA|nr:MAG: twin-arginine translocase TatA/TatE family subunit [Gammaproteobacteria bacterium HGW-Gammaproteobacteria-3]
MGISVTQLLIILVIVIVLFGTKRLRNLGSDLGSAIKSFRSAVKDGETDKKLTEEVGETLDDQITAKDNKKV